MSIVDIQNDINTDIYKDLVAYEGKNIFFMCVRIGKALLIIVQSAPLALR
jgi:hypothetical protein